MAKGIKIGSVKGDVVVSTDQSGGVTAHTSNSAPPVPPKTFWTWFVVIVTVLASIVTILAYFNIYPFSKTQGKQPLPDTVTKVTPKIEQEKPNISKQPKTMNESHKKETPINIGTVTGDVTISQNQTGGITAHTVYVNKPLPRELNDDDQRVLKSLNKEYLISVTVIMGNESQKYGTQIIDFLQSNGYKTSLNYVGVQSPEPEPARYHIHTDDDSKTIEIMIPKEGI
ncbi:hypothetical protein [[Flexibacter] sp. ATCC 35208]|uniref:hypothetical protein n=1 Tax=[Flexibacter] sp. ATCC 35208 TaxID=1936242 RepID=UPI0009D5BBFE|nr:hypothetical protein [[Flexibacter] sp. ATCC 35208]OMP75570.1 hypothetical protein BW716_29415 [[Flexibacter] sp. ATCC 35208]